MVKIKDDKLSSAYINYNNSEKAYQHHLNLDYKHNPFVGYTLKRLKKELNEEVILETNQIGLRCPELNLIKSCDAILLGGSVAFSTYARSENDTISKLAEKISKKKIINCGVPGHVLKQHVSLYFNYLKNIKSENIIIMFGFNDMVNCFMGRNYEGIINEHFTIKTQQLYDEPIKSSLKTILSQVLIFFGLKKYVFNKILKKKILKRNEKFDDMNISIDNYLNDIKKEITFFQNFCDRFNIKLHLILQPSLYVTKKNFSTYEKRRFDEWNLIPNRKFYVENFYKKIDHLLSNFNSYYNFSNCFDNEKDTIFIDECHFVVRGSLIVSDLLSKIIK